MAIIVLFPMECLAKEEWDFKVSLTKHKIEIKTNSQVGQYNGKPFHTSGPILKNGRLYIPLRFLRDAGLASISWNAKDKSADLVLAGSDAYVRYQAHKPLVSFLISNGLGEKVLSHQISVPAPFIKNNTLYIPVKSLDQVLGKNIPYANNTMTISWCIPLIQRNNFTETVTENSRVLKVLYDAEFDAPFIMRANIGFASSLPRGKITEEIINGKKFFRYQATVPLQPGGNPFHLLLKKGSLSYEEPFVINREVPDGLVVPIISNQFCAGDVYPHKIVEINEPPSGYIKFPAPGPMNFKGRLLQERFGDNKLSLEVSKLVKGKYQEYSTIELPVLERQFGAVVDFAEPGFYLVQVISPKYMPSIDYGLAATTWGLIRVEVGTDISIEDK